LFAECSKLTIILGCEMVNDAEARFFLDIACPIFRAKLKEKCESATALPVLNHTFERQKDLQGLRSPVTRIHKTSQALDSRKSVMRFEVRCVSIILLHLIVSSMGVQSLHVPSSQSQKVSFRSHDGSSWVVPKPREHENNLPALNAPGPTFRVLIVDRDSMSSALLASALTRDGNSQAFGVQSADLLDNMAEGKADLVVIGAALSHDTKNGTAVRLQIEQNQLVSNIA
jgi:hypothetical protein